ncbi:acetolactate decarboxylase [Flavobacterium sp. CSZ]|uniref:acetolactate decarboxylase n=1 Tax=Flavobacterium sp. CSZ TaxID=2783791 RepID=UPI00188D6ADB|nr:acetolactate decarboxylase [Flavobacterium sp. CSZ]MBF4486354.1 acetolactate decarboxylase [Flavobacterium sp. CSZ]
MRLIQIITVFAFLCFKVQAQQHDAIYHYSVMDAMRNGIYQGEHNIEYLAAKGDFGLGTYNFLDGELIALDGVFYRIGSDGKVVEETKRKSPFISLVKFKKDTEITFHFNGTTQELQQKLITLLPSQNMPYAIKITCSFTEITTGGAEKIASADTTGLAILMKNRPLYKTKNITGTLVGFYNPPHFSTIDLSPFHFHFIADDKTYGGHLVAGLLKGSLTLSLDEKNGYNVELLKNNQRFRSAKLENNDKKSSY